MPLLHFIFKILFTFSERGRQGERERETGLPLTCLQLGTWPATQACALTGNETCDFLGVQASTQSTEPHQPGLLLLLLIFILFLLLCVYFYILIQAFVLLM